MTSNLCKNFFRAKSNRPDREFIAEQDSRFWDYNSMDSYQEEQALKLLYEALEELPQMYQEVLTLHYLGGMKNKEIARFLGTSESNIKQRLSRARAKLKKEMLDMMSTTYEGERLQPNFTFRIVEIVKHMKPASSMPRLPWGLPWGISVATGIFVLTVISFSPYLIPLTPLGALFGSPMPSETKVEQVGELPVEVLELSEITFLSSQQGDGNDGIPEFPNPQNAFAPPLAPPGEEGIWTRKADMPTARSGPSASVANGKIYVIGGGPDMSPPRFPFSAFSTVEVYDTGSRAVEAEGKLPTIWGEEK